MRNLENHFKNIRELAKGRWFEILAEAGIATNFLTGRHCPCPVCGGRDRFRWDNKEERGTFYCTHCKPGDGIDLLKNYKGWSAKEAFDFVKDLLGSGRIIPTGPKPILSHIMPTGEKVLKTKRDELKAEVDQILSWMVNASPNHPYLEKKQIYIDGLKAIEGNLLIPIYEGDYSLVSFQKIWPNGKPLILKGTTVVGSYGAVGRQGSSEILLLGEGWATVASVYLSTGHIGHISFGVNNLKAALETLLINLPVIRKVVIAADNDESGVGYAKAKEALSVIGFREGHIIMPDKIKPGRTKSDWSDVFVEEGKDAVRLAFVEVLS